MSDIIVPHNYQELGADFLLRSEGAILADQVGLGKTLTSLLAVIGSTARRILIIVPLALKPWWVSEIVRVERILADAVIFYATDTEVSTGRRHYTLAHYEQFRNGESSKLPGELTRQYLDKTWDIVILDEAHKIKGRDSQRTRWIKKLHTEQRWALSGTPMAEYPPDIWSLLNWADPQTFRYYWPFVNEYCELDDNRRVIGIKHVLQNGRYTQAPTLEAFRETLRPYILARKLKDVGIELPPQTITDVPLKMADDQAAFYEEVATQVVIELAEKSLPEYVLDFSRDNKLVIQNVGVRFTRLHQVASNPAHFKPGVSNIKLAWLDEYIEGGGEPSLVFTRYRGTVDVINRLLSLRNQRGWLVGTWDGLAEGLNLQRYAHTITWDLPYPLLSWTQGLGRTHRMGQTRPTRVTRLLVQGSVDQRVAKKLDGKANLTTMLMEWLRGLYDRR